MAAALRARGLAGMLLTSPENVFYTTGYTTLPSAGNPILYMLRNRLPFFAFVTADGGVTLLCWAFSALDMEFGVDTVIGFNSFAEAVAAVRAVVAALPPGGGALGIESTCPHFVLDAIGALAGTLRVAAVDDLLDGLRLIKSPAEVGHLRTSLDIIETTCGELYDVLRVGMRRNELTREAKTRLMRNGADGVSHLTFSFGQANPEFDIDEPLEANRLVTLDLGGIYRGYCSDNRRYAFAGRVPPGMQERYDKMVAIVDTVGAALVPGTPYNTLMDLAVRLYDQHGVAPLPRFNHIGHGIGIETEERWVDDDKQARIEAGMVINIELYTPEPSGGQIGDEETFVIGDSGSTRISRLPRVIREIG
jgi:Xaa-Pro aminopeptidase